MSVRFDVPITNGGSSHHSHNGNCKDEEEMIDNKDEEVGIVGLSNDNEVSDVSSVDESTYIGDNHRGQSVLGDSRPAYDFRKFLPKHTSNPFNLARWFATGVAPDGSVRPGLTEVEVDENTRKAARMVGT